jgi:hypothetical protein
MNSDKDLNIYHPWRTKGVRKLETTILEDEREEHNGGVW